MRSSKHSTIGGTTSIRGMSVPARQHREIQPESLCTARPGLPGPPKVMVPVASAMAVVPPMSLCQPSFAYIPPPPRVRPDVRWCRHIVEHLKWMVHFLLSLWLVGCWLVSHGIIGVQVDFPANYCKILFWLKSPKLWSNLTVSWIWSTTLFMNYYNAEYRISLKCHYCFL